MKLRFQGVRGSYTQTGATTVKYGGNTSCVHVTLNSGQHVIFDAGTGIMSLKSFDGPKEAPLFLLLTHTHWDHINGFPFFMPIHQPNRELIICTGAEESSYPDNIPLILGQIDSLGSPLDLFSLPCNLNVVGQSNIVTSMKDHNIHIDTKALNHPGGGTAYIIREDDLSVAYITDNELSPPGKITTSYEEWVNFLSHVDVLIHDAQYVEADMPFKHGWGHSLISQVRQLAIDAEVQTLALYHHDPERTDAELDDIQRENEKIFKGLVCPTQSITAMEGMTMEITKSKTASGDHFISVKSD